MSNEVVYHTQVRGWSFEALHGTLKIIPLSQTLSKQL